VSTLIACLIAGVCALGFVTIWLRTAFRELSAKWENLADLEGQLRLHQLLFSQRGGGPEATSVAGMLETGRMLCREAAKDYNRILRKPMNRFPALLLGFQTAEENR